MSNILTRKLELFGPIPEADRRLLDQVIKTDRRFAAGEAIIEEGDRPDRVHLVLDGIAYRAKTLDDGRKQIFAFLLPGDLGDSHIFILEEMDHTITALSSVLMAEIDPSQMMQMMERPALARAIWFTTLIDEATLREWVVNAGQRAADERAAHLFCELHLRLHSVGLTTDGSFSLPITQEQLGWTLGLSTVHVNRTLQGLRKRELVDLKPDGVAIPDVGKLREFAGFNPNYLHLGAVGQRH